MRSRSEPTFTNVINYDKRTRTSTNSGSTWSAWSYQTNSVTNSGVRSTQDETTPNYKTLLKNKDLVPPTRFIQTVSEVTWNPAVWHTVSKTSATNRTEVDYPDGYYGVGTGLGPWPLTPSLPSLVSSSLPDALIRAASAEVGGEGIDGLTFIAELSKARKLMLTVCQRILDFRHNSDEWHKAFMSIPGLWLEARFGLRPLISDITAINEQLHRVSRMESRIYAKSRSKAEGLVIPKFESDVTGSGINVHSEVTYECTANYRGTVAAKMVNGGFGFNPLATAWELMPWSFIIDWVIDIGSTINSALQVFLSRKTYACAGWKISVKETRTKTISPVLGGSYLVATGGASCTVYNELVQRDPRSINFLPGINIRIDSFKAIDAWMLLIGQMLSAWGR